MLMDFSNFFCCGTCQKICGEVIIKDLLLICLVKYLAPFQVTVAIGLLFLFTLHTYITITADNSS